MTDPLETALRYRFLSRAFAYPNEALVPELEKCLEELGEAPETFTKLVEAFGKEKQEQLQGEYTRLFLNGYPKTPCIPYESVYLEKRMLGEASLAVGAAYAEWEMQVEPGVLDHVSTELEFLAFLASAESMGGRLAKDARKASESFLTEHLCRWVPRLAADLAREAKMEPFRLLGEALQTVRCPS